MAKTNAEILLDTTFVKQFDEGSQPYGKRVAATLNKLDGRVLYPVIYLYPDGSFKTGWVNPSVVEEFVIEEIAYRPGRAFFISGKLIYQGYVSNTVCSPWLKTALHYIL